MQRSKKVDRLGLLFVAVVGASFAGWQSAGAQDADGVIHACVHEAGNLVSTGNLRIVDDPSHCRKHERSIAWNITGPAGADGKDGVDGKDGKDGKDGRDGVDGTNGIDGKDGVNGTDGTCEPSQCVPPPTATPSAPPATPTPTPPVQSENCNCSPVGFCSDRAVCEQVYGGVCGAPC